MNLNFKRIGPDGRGTNFAAKIWAGLYSNESELGINAAAEFWKLHNREDLNTEGDGKILIPKIHTIRQDPKRRWKKGNKIHFQQWKGAPYRSPVFQFGPVIPCTGTQEISFRWSRLSNTSRCFIEIDGKTIGGADYYHDQLVAADVAVLNLAKNDGFKTAEGLLEWFQEDFEGVIIHWTNFKY